MAAYSITEAAPVLRLLHSSDRVESTMRVHLSGEVLKIEATLNVLK
jgi:hypothetical protein